MAEEEPKTTTPETAEGGKEETSNGEGKGKRDNKKRDEKPIEELYDLSQPIPRVSPSTRDLRRIYADSLLGICTSSRTSLDSNATDMADGMCSEMWLSTFFHLQQNQTFSHTTSSSHSCRLKSLTRLVTRKQWL